MSSCLILQQNKNIFIAGDTAISSTLSGQRIRVSNSGEKVFIKDNNIIFCSGNVKLANKCKSFIMNMRELNIAKLHSFLLGLDVDTMFELFIGVTGDIVKSYQLSSYNSFEPIERVVENNTEIFALGFNTKSMLESFENSLSKVGVLEALTISYKENICNEIGGRVDICYFYNGEIQKVEYDLNDTTKCLLDVFSEDYLHYIIAEQLIGKVILGEQLYIGNGNNTFKILPNGLYVYDDSSAHEERIFLGLEQVNGVNMARLRLHSATGDKSLVLSEEGIYQVSQLSDRDSFDFYNPFDSYFYIPNTLKNIFEARMIVHIQPFRSYSKTSAGGGGISQTETSAGGGDFTIKSDTADGGYYHKSTTSEDWAGKHISGGPASADGEGNNSTYGSHWHWIDTRHSHNFTIEVPNHKHNFTVENGKHTHDVTIEVENHTHEAIYGIYETNYYPEVEVYIGEVLVATLDKNKTSGDFYVTERFKQLANGSHKVRIKTSNPKHLGRASFTLFWGGFYSYD